jgi:leucyl aminopeptidase (aminopeptidase T)
MSYEPTADILEKYAKLLVDFALGGGTGIKKGEVVHMSSGLSALPLYRALRKAVFDSGGIGIGSLGDDMSGMGKYFYDHATDD